MTFIHLIIAILVFSGALVMLLTSRDEKTEQRIRSVSGEVTTNTSEFSFKDLLRPPSQSASDRRRHVEESIEGLDADKKTRAKRRKTVKSMLRQANIYAGPRVFWTLSLVAAILTFVVLVVFGFNALISLGFGAGVGIGLPRWVLTLLVKRRQKKFTENFADAMDIIVRGVKTGLPLNDCLKIIAHESQDPIKTEFETLVEAEKVGAPLETSLEQLFERVPLPEVSFFATVLSIQRKSGGNLAEALGNLSAVLRGRKLLREKIAALASEAKASAMIIGALPIVVMIVVSITSPEYMSELFTTKTGHIALGGCAITMLVGIFVMRRMINFKY